jgi:hypothetical protein
MDENPYESLKAVARNNRPQVMTVRAPSPARPHRYFQGLAAAGFRFRRLPPAALGSSLLVYLPSPHQKKSFRRKRRELE